MDEKHYCLCGDETGNAPKCDTCKMFAEDEIREESSKMARKQEKGRILKEIDDWVQNNIQVRKGESNTVVAFDLLLLLERLKEKVRLTEKDTAEDKARESYPVQSQQRDMPVGNLSSEISTDCTCGHPETAHSFLLETEEESCDICDCPKFEERSK